MIAFILGVVVAFVFAIRALGFFLSSRCRGAPYRDPRTAGFLIAGLIIGALIGASHWYAPYIVNHW